MKVKNTRSLLSSSPATGGAIGSLLVLVAVFCFGIFMGQQRERTSSSGSGGSSSRALPTPGSVLSLEDLEFRSTTHVDKQGRPIRKKQFLEPFKIPNLTGFSVAVMQPGQSVPAHEHENMHEIFYVYKGKATFTVDGVDHVATEGTMVHAAPHERHGIVVDENESEDLVMAYFGVTI
jgi:quercetin dioxygenase-like cupin family protein